MVCLEAFVGEKVTSCDGAKSKDAHNCWCKSVTEKTLVAGYFRLYQYKVSTEMILAIAQAPTVDLKSLNPKPDLNGGS